MSLSVKDLRKKKSITQAQLANEIGVTRQTIINWEKGLTVPDQDDLEKMSKVFGMSVTKPVRTDKIPFYDAIAVGGHLMLADQDAVYDSLAEMIDPGTFLRGASGSLRIYGHSMFPKYPAGCIVAFKDADKECIIWGEDYVIELEDRRIIKRVERHDKPDYIKAVSYNKSDEYVYDPIDIPLRKVKRLHMVIGKVELESSI